MLQSQVEWVRRSDFVGCIVTLRFEPGPISQQRDGIGCPQWEGAGGFQ
jgi:hypothetical protein